MFDQDRAPEWPVTLTAPPVRRVVTSCAAAFFVPGAAVRVVGQVDGTYATDATGIVGTVLIVFLAAVLALGTWAVWSSRVVVDDTEVEQRLGRSHWSVPLAAGTRVTLRRKVTSGPGWSSASWQLRLDRPEHRPVMISSASYLGFDTALLAVSLAGRHEPSLLADPTLRAVLRDPGLLGGSKAEVELAVADEEAAPSRGDDVGDGTGDGTGDGATGR